MRIVSLLPSATESLFALGLGGDLVARTHECDFPPEAAPLPVVTRSTHDLDGRASGSIEDAVALAAREGRSLYEVDTDAILRLDPDLVVAQDICDVCAIPADQVADALAGVRILRQHPHSLTDVLGDIEELADACGADARPLLSSLRRRIEAASEQASGLPRVRGVFLEWLDPPYPAGERSRRSSRRSCCRKTGPWLQGPHLATVQSPNPAMTGSSCRAEKRARSSPDNSPAWAVPELSMNSARQWRSTASATKPE